MAEIKRVTVVLDAETKKLNRGLKNADKKIKQSTVLMKKMGAALAGVFAVAKIKASIAATVEYARAITDLRRAFGLTNEQAQRLLFTSDALGLEIRAFTESMKEVKKRATEARKSSKDIREAFEAIGITPEQAEAMQDLELVVRALRGIGAAAPGERNFLADRIFGGMGAEVFQAVFNDVEHLNEVLGQAGDVTTTAFDTRGLDQMNVASAQVLHSWNQIKLDLANNILPNLEGALGWITENKNELAKISGWVKKIAVDWNPIVLLLKLIDMQLGFIADRWHAITTAVKDAFGWVAKVARIFSSGSGLLGSLGFGTDDSTARRAAAPDSTPFAPAAPFVGQGQGPLTASPAPLVQNIYASGMSFDQVTQESRRRGESVRRENGR